MTTYKSRNQYETIKIEQVWHEAPIRSDEKGFYITYLANNKKLRLYLAEDFTYYQNHQVYKFAKNHELHKLLGFTNNGYYFEITQKNVPYGNGKKSAWITLYKHISYYDKMSKEYRTPYGLESDWDVKHKKHSWECFFYCVLSIG